MINIYISSYIISRLGVMNLLESYFYWHGVRVARYPGYVICLSVLVSLTSSLGLVWFREEVEMTALWVPHGSKFREDFKWVEENFPKQLRWRK